MKQVQIAVLKRQMSKHLREAEAGETIEVLDRARPIARLVPIASAVNQLETRPPERPFATVRKVKSPKLTLGVSSLDVLAVERGPR